MTESDWKNKVNSTNSSVNVAAATTTASFVKKVPMSATVSHTPTIQPLDTTTTAVNPRERPKAAHHHLNPIVPLASANTTPNNPANTIPKLSLSIKPLIATSSVNKPGPQMQQQTATMAAFAPVSNTPGASEQFGFEDDFSSLNTVPATYPDQSNSHSAAVAGNAPSLLLPQPVNSSEKKTHRRSASHSSSMFVNASISANNDSTDTASMSLNMQQSSQPAQQQPDLINMNPPTPSQQIQQQLQYQQYQMYQYQQQMMQQQLQQQHQMAHLQPGQTNRHLMTHSRSASASPKLVLFSFKSEI